MRAHRHRERLSFPITLAGIPSMNVMFMVFSVFTTHLKPIFDCQICQPEGLVLPWSSPHAKEGCGVGSSGMNGPVLNLSALGLPSESSQEVVHEVHKVTFVLPHKPIAKSHHMNTSLQSLPLPDPKTYWGRLSSHSQCLELPWCMRRHLCYCLVSVLLVALDRAALCPAHQDCGPTPWAAPTLVSLFLVPIQVAARAVPCPSPCGLPRT